MKKIDNVFGASVRCFEVNHFFLSLDFADTYVVKFTTSELRVFGVQIAAKYFQL